MIAAAILVWGLVAGLFHSVAMVVLYGNPRVARIHAAHDKPTAAPRSERSGRHNFTIQFLGTQIEVYVMTIGYVWLHPLLPLNGLLGAILLAVLFAVLRVCGPVWALWMQRTYSYRYLLVEIVGGVLGSIVVALTLYVLM
ncbi:hypothetical protein AB0B25_28030 [Nocardia sp. NPDC049190]|uniref:hypothetical protein n=1 Tax=Nocardia sp. NPDC049190 TaxID=3155650 RepID=UPI0033E7821F